MSHVAAVHAVMELERNPRDTLSRARPVEESGGGFLSTLIDAISQRGVAAPLYRIRAGDTLSGICKSALSERHRTVSRKDIAAAVKTVAAANGLASPDRIYAGQTLDLTCLDGAASPVAQGGRSMPWRPQLREVLNLLQERRPISGQSCADTVVDGARVTSGYGIRRNPFTKEVEYHQGMDLAAAALSPVYAAMPGEVIFSGWQSGYGKTVIIRHSNGFETLYGHNSVNLVRCGQHVSAATPIAKVGSTGDSTGPHVHFELRRNGVPVDPATAVGSESVQVTQTLEGLDVLL